MKLTRTNVVFFEVAVLAIVVSLLLGMSSAFTQPAYAKGNFQGSQQQQQNRRPDPNWGQSEPRNITFDISKVMIPVCGDTYVDEDSTDCALTHDVENDCYLHEDGTICYNVIRVEWDDAPKAVPKTTEPIAIPETTKPTVNTPDGDDDKNGILDFLKGFLNILFYLSIILGLAFVVEAIRYFTSKIFPPISDDDDQGARGTEYLKQLRDKPNDE